MKLIIVIGLFFNFFGTADINHNYLDEQINISISSFKDDVEEYKEFQRVNYFKGESKELISKKIEKYLNSTLDGKGKLITEYSLEIGMDPYLASSVMLVETGCYWGCSSLVRNCNNVGGNKGTPSCNGGSYRKFDTLDDGIKFSIRKLNNYYKKGLTTPKEINPYYAEDQNWYKKVENYMKKIKKG